MQILMGFILKVCISYATSVSVTDIFRLIKCHSLPMVTVNNSTKTRWDAFPLLFIQLLLPLTEGLETDSARLPDPSEQSIGGCVSPKQPL